MTKQEWKATEPNGRGNGWQAGPAWLGEDAGSARTAAYARLIAAAPELLESLEDMLALFRSIALMKGWDWNDYAESVKARAAIAKATQE